MYLVDANVLIEAKNRYYAFDIAPGFWEWLEGAHAAGEVGSIEATPAGTSLDPLDRGFAVSRTYEAIDDPADVRRDDDGTWLPAPEPARATTPGTFTAGPPKAEEMYSPEVFGRGATDQVVVGWRAGRTVRNDEMDRFPTDLSVRCATVERR